MKPLSWISAKLTGYVFELTPRQVYRERLMKWN